MRVIYKYKVSPKFKLDLPANAQVLHVNVQQDSPVMWVILDPEAEKVQRQFISVATGEEIGVGLKLDYFGTFMLENGGLVFHLFEVKNEQGS